MASSNRRNCRRSTLDPNQSTWLNCVLPKRARTTNDRDERVNNYQQSQSILVSLRTDSSVLTWLRPVRQIAVAIKCVKVARLRDRGFTHQPNRRDRRAGSRFQQVNLGNRRCVKSVEFRVILWAKRVDAARRLCLTSVRRDARSDCGVEREGFCQFIHRAPLIGGGRSFRPL
jgi:hypothetical protein